MQRNLQWQRQMATKRKAPEASGSVLLETDEASCEIGLFGGHILSWKVNEEEQVFMSSKAKLHIFPPYSLP